MHCHQDWRLFQIFISDFEIPLIDEIRFTENHEGDTFTCPLYFLLLYFLFCSSHLNGLNGVVLLKPQFFCLCLLKTSLGTMAFLSFLRRYDSLSHKHLHSSRAIEVFLFSFLLFYLCLYLQYALQVQVTRFIHQIMISVVIMSCRVTVFCPQQSHCSKQGRTRQASNA